MIHYSEKRSTFVFKIWREEDSVREQSVWRGWVQHVHSGDRRYLQSTQELIQFIEKYTGELTSIPPSRLK